jgi:endoglucanase Acf2
MRTRTLLSRDGRAVALLVVVGALCWGGPAPAAERPARRSEPRADQAIKVGAGSYAKAVPWPARPPQGPIYKTEAVRAKMPTNDWWSSVAWEPFSERQYPHPLAVRCVAGGLRVYYPGPRIRADKAAIFGAMPEGGDEDLVLGCPDLGTFYEARVDGWSDWFVRVAFGPPWKRMLVTYGHGSPFVYAIFEGGGSATVTFPEPPAVWAGRAREAVLGVTVRGKPYALFGPTGSTWEGLETKVFTNRAGKRPYFSLALLPANTPEALALFKKYAYAHVTDTRAAWRYEPQGSALVTDFTFTTKAYEGEAEGTLFALYPHQWTRTSQKLLDFQYASVRGPMKLAAGTSFTTRMTYPGVLPSLPDAGGCDKARLDGYLNAEVPAKPPEEAPAWRPGEGPPRRPEGPRDTYWEGKLLGKLATLVPLAEQTGNTAARQALLGETRRRLEDWLTAAGPGGWLKRAGLFAYNEAWGTLIGCPPSYGSDTELNDHHFHYGYFIRAAAEVARNEPEWAADEKWGGMVRLLIRDIASPDRNDPMFPFLRCFDPYAGHSWASGSARFGDGNNQESSSEAMNAWYGLLVWGEATGDRVLRDLGIYLYTTEMEAIDAYWFDVGGTNFPKTYPASTVTMVWGGKGACGTWFSAEPEAIHGINWLPITGGSLYLGRYPDYVRKNYDALTSECGSTEWKMWGDLVWMYRALVDPEDALRQFDAGETRAALEGGNSRANAYHWIAALAALGRVDRTVTADCPLYAVFLKDGQRTYVVYNMTDKPLAATFSDGTKVEARGKGFATARKAAG